MEIKKVENNMNCFDIWVKEDNKELKIMYGRNLDLYMIMSNGRLIPDNENTKISIDITKENPQLYDNFDKLYNSIISGNVFEDKKGDFSYYLESYEYQKLVDENKNITWISDNGIAEYEDRFTISKHGDDAYRLTFFRNDKTQEFGFKDHTGISVRISTSGSRYNHFYCPFMFMFQRLQDIDTKQLDGKPLAKTKNSTRC